MFIRNAERASDQHAESVSSDVAGFVRKLAIEGQGSLVCRERDIVSILLNAGLIDRIILPVHPTVLGRGRSLFKGIEWQVEMKLTRTIPYESGLVQLHYEL